MLRLNNLKIRTTMNTKMSVFVICLEVIIYLSLYNLHDRTFNLVRSSFTRSVLRLVLMVTVMFAVNVKQLLVKKAVEKTPVYRKCQNREIITSSLLDI